jgi:hypothetical protein
MTIGDKSKFAIESEISQAYARLSFRAIGYFNIHINGIRYGVCAQDATLLACSFDEVQRRVANRGRHLAPFSSDADAGGIISAFREAIYTPERKDFQYSGIVLADFNAIFEANHIVWAPDGDQAFDDGSYVLQFDVADRVRLIAFKVLEHGGRYDPLTLADVWLEGHCFYSVLSKWLSAFELEWTTMPKVVE